MTVVHDQRRVSALPTPVIRACDVGLLPGPAAVPARLRQASAGPSAEAATLVLIGLLYRSVGWSLAPSTMTTVVAAVTRALRAEDWIGRSGIDGLAVVIGGRHPAAALMAQRLVRVVNDLRTPGVAACAAVATLEPGADPADTLSTATARLRVAGRLGPGAVVAAD